ncbi:MAG: alkaline phosphatase family protein [Acidobacteriota bacterium]
MLRTLLPVAIALSCLACLACGGSPSRVLVLGLDGMDPEVVDLLIPEGELPHFAELRRNGAAGSLRSQRPLLSPILWTTIATGREPVDHGIGHFVASDSRGREIPASSRLRRVEALWNIASRNERPVATVGWWATWPPEPIEGTMISDHVAYHFLFGGGFAGGRRSNPGLPQESARDKTWPPDAADRMAPFLRRPGDLGLEDLAPFVDVSAEDLAASFDFSNDLAHFRWALATAQSYRDIGLDLWRRERPALAMIYIEGVDSTSHLFGHLFRAEGLAGELAEQQAKYGRAVEGMYRFADELVGEYLAAMDEDTTLVVLSDHGFELGTLHDDPSKTRDLRRVSERFHRLEGILYLYGHRVVPGSRFDGASILDIAPTVLALLDLPAAEKMPGRVLSEGLAELQVKSRIATWEPAEGRRQDDSPDTETSRVQQAQREHLANLGYLAGASPAAEEIHDTAVSERNLAAIDFRAGRYREAANRYARLVAEEPDNAALRASFAGALGSLGRHEEALRELDRALELEPLNVEAYHNRAVLFELREEVDAAIADYRTALRYDPQYEPSAEALLRLTGRRDPRPAAEPAVARLIEGASEAARRGDYPAALHLLATAEGQAPNEVLIYQYRSNVAYLMGDRAGAIAALERALELEPDNALFKSNLERLTDE